MNAIIYFFLIPVIFCESFQKNQFTWNELLTYEMMFGQEQVDQSKRLFEIWFHSQKKYANGYSSIFQPT